MTLKNEKSKNASKEDLKKVKGGRGKGRGKGQGKGAGGDRSTAGKAGGGKRRN